MIYSFGGDGWNGDVGGDDSNENNRGGVCGGIMKCGGECEHKNRRCDAVLTLHCCGAYEGAEISFSKTKKFFKNPLIFANLYVRINDR